MDVNNGIKYKKNTPPQKKALRIFYEEENS